MTLVSVGGLAKYYGAELIFQAINFQIARGDKIALVGVNGAGKSTLLKILAGLETPDTGQVASARGTRVAYLAQEVRFTGEQTLWQEMEAALSNLALLQREIEALEPLIADTNGPDWAAHMERYGELTARFEHGGGYEVEQRIKRTLQGLGFHEAHYHQRLNQFSGGQKTRAALAATLLADPDLLLLDEPTNHLDMQALEWLELFLRNWDGTLVVISHDRYFLDRVTKRTLELAFGTLEDYPAPYQKYLELKAERLERRMKEFQAQQEFIAKTEEFIRRYKAGQRAREAKGREKRLERLKRDHGLDRPREQAKLKLFLDAKLRSGDLVLALDGLVIGYPGDRRHESEPRVLLRADGLELTRGERVALLGPNGCGKTTLLRTLIDQLKPLQGQPRLGHQVQIGYYAQGHDLLNWEATVLEELLRVGPNLGEAAARTMLGRFLFSGDDVFKRIADLSGGERSRVALAQLMVLPGNLLILDEPTNHLDIGAREALEGVLRDYPGSILFVSHDRYFIDAVADRIWLIEEGRMRSYLGGYSAFMAAREAQPASQSSAHEQQRSKQAEASSVGSPNTSSQISAEERQRKKRIAALESEVALLEQELGQLKAELEAASAAQDIKQITALGTQYAELEDLLAAKYEQWEQLAA
ncbi:ABC-F family ATP-binding cassette domain-containing protein [Candidatus Viridilinea mediisalina]|uniref:ABC transporter n=1 Tax=Candidatus Viridilinea mediisalina TaxID=2024553 RepID=A0A2A6RPI5_9CHLR|nr:ABC-F family ATP-binding cassette domain-containing protein [Candidatus Viridilinea mediisalina]PDW04821.1 ABC transporter [Candidatus Viridilinea mediisalina]